MDTPPPPPPPDPTTTTAATATTTVNNRDQFLRHLTHLNKLSHKISKPPHHRPSPPPPPPQQPPQQPPHPQPPVYNISKTDFRDVVQKLTGSPSHPPPPPPQHASASSSAASTKPNSSRLQRIRPPPLAQLITRPPSPLVNSRFGSGSGFGPMSPLPPLPSCHGAAESPISAYMRLINSFPPPENAENLEMLPPTSPLGFGCLQSPKLIMMPLSPTVPGVSSPK